MRRSAPSRSFPRRFAWMFAAALCLGSLAALAQDRAPASPQAQAEKLTPFKAWMRSLVLNRHAVSDARGTLITETSLLGPRRSYQKWKDAQGREREVYQENGQVKGIDAALHQWVEAALRDMVPMAPPTPPTPLSPALPGVPQVPPPPPTFDSVAAFSDSEWYQVILKRIEGEPRVTDLLGSPLAIAPLGGEVQVDTWEKGEPHGFDLFAPTGGKDVTVEVPIHGPKGAALLRAKAHKGASGWTFSRLVVQPSGGGARLNLLAR